MKKLLVILFIVMFIGIASAEMEWDNVKSYDDLTKTATITDNLGFGGALAEITLTSPHNVNVIYGEDRLVAEFTIKNYGDYDNVFNDLDFINLKNGKTMTKNFQYKYKNYITHNVDDYAEICKLNDLGNGTSLKYDCYLEEVGKHNETYFEWKPLNDKAILPEGDWEIGLFVDVMPNEKGEWIPTFYGKSIPEWATWTEALNVDILGYWAFEENSTAFANDSVNGYDMTFYGASLGTSNGKIGNGHDFPLASNPYGKTANITTTGTNVTVNGWIKLRTAVNYAGVFGYGSNFTSDSKLCTVYYQLDGADVFAVGCDAGANNGPYSASGSAGNWLMVTSTYNYNTKNATLYLNGTLATSYTDTNAIIGGPFLLNTRYDLYDKGDAIYDEFGVWGRMLTNAEITQLYNGGTGITYVANFDNPPQVTLNTPIEAENFTDYTVIFNATISDDNQITNASLYIDGVINQTNVSVVNNTQVTFTSNLPDGDHSWYYVAYDNNTAINISSIRNFTIDTSPVITVFSPTNTTYTDGTIYFNATATQSVNNWIVNYNGTNYSLSSINSTINVEEGNFQLLFYGENVGTGVYGLNDSVHFGVDSTNPTVFITSPSGNVSFQEANKNMSVNWTALDTHLDTCILSYNSINYTVTCADNGTFINTTSPYVKTATFYVNDTFGNKNVTTFNWDYYVFLNSDTYNSIVFEGTTNPFTANITAVTGYTPTIAYLYYNSTFDTGSITSVGGGSYNLSDSLTAPSVSASTNKTFYWNVFVAGTNVNTTSRQQTVKPLSIDNCAVNTIQILNFTLADEGTKALINESLYNTTINVDLDIFSPSSFSTPYAEYYNTFSSTNPARICINDTLGSSEYYMYLTADYDGDSYAHEYYNIQNYSFNGTSNPNQNITLYDLLDADAQTFKISYKDSSFLPVKDALIQIQRYYIGDGISRTVEILKTDAQGEATGSLVVDSIIYSFIVSKQGTVLASYPNVYAKCQNPTITECSISFNSFASDIPASDFFTDEDFSYSLNFNKTSRVVDSSFTIPSGSVSYITLNVTKTDALGTEVCTDAITTSSGSLSCVVSSSFGNGTVSARLYKDGELIGFGNLNVERNPSDIYGGSLVIIGLFILLTLIGAAMSDNPVFTVIFFLIGVGLLISLNLIANNGFIGSTSTILWLVMAIIIIVIKARRTN